MSHWMHWAVTCVVAVVAGCLGAVVAIQLGGANEQIKQVSQPAIDASAARQQEALDAAVQDEQQKIAEAVGAITRNILDRVTALEDREYRIGTGYECNIDLHAVTVVTVTYGGSATDVICVVED